MTQRNEFGGNIIVPLSDHIGFGVPGTGDSSSGPRVIASNGDPNGLPVPIGSFALDYTTPAVWQATDAIGTWVQVGAGGGAGPANEFIVDDTGNSPGGYTTIALALAAANATLAAFVVATLRIVEGQFHTWNLGTEWDGLRPVGLYAAGDNRGDPITTVALSGTTPPGSSSGISFSNLDVSAAGVTLTDDPFLTLFDCQFSAFGGMTIDKTNLGFSTIKMSNCNIVGSSTRFIYTAGNGGGVLVFDQCNCFDASRSTDAPLIDIGDLGTGVDVSFLNSDIYYRRVGSPTEVFSLTGATPAASYTFVDCDFLIDMEQDPFSIFGGGGATPPVVFWKDLRLSVTDTFTATPKGGFLFGSRTDAGTSLDEPNRVTILESLFSSMPLDAPDGTTGRPVVPRRTPWLAFESAFGWFGPSKRYWLSGATNAGSLTDTLIDANNNSALIKLPTLGIEIGYRVSGTISVYDGPLAGAAFDVDALINVSAAGVVTFPAIVPGNPLLSTILDSSVGQYTATLTALAGGINVDVNQAAAGGTNAWFADLSIEAIS